MTGGHSSMPGRLLTNFQTSHMFSHTQLLPVLRRVPHPTQHTCRRQVHLWSAPQDQQSPTRALDVGRQLAALRAASRLLEDPSAGCLIDEATATLGSELSDEDFFDLISTRFVDEQTLQAVNAVNVGRNLEYNQAVLVGDGFCTRPFRLPWPSGTVIYLVAPGEVHERAEAALNQAKRFVPRGCLLRRVDCDFTEGKSFHAALEAAGYRGDRLSVWALQGIRRLGLSTAAVSALLADMSNLAAFESLLVGELPPCTPQEAENLLAAFGLLGTTFSAATIAEKYSEECTEVGVWRKQQAEIATGGGGGGESRRPLLFRAQQRRLSEAEINTYESHVAAAEDVGEDFDGHFS